LPVAVARSRDEAEREMLYTSIIALHRDVREILHLVREGGVARAWEGMREVRTDGGTAGEGSLSLDQLERAAVREALGRAAGNRRKAADFLGISERTLYRKIKEYGLA
jgi:DNA-binding NtrC family response regulator